MPARIPRRTFARPFVVTLAAAPACYTQAPPPSQPPAAQQPAPAPTPEATPTPPPTVIANPPRPMPASSYADGTKWTIFKNASGCEATMNVECPHGKPGEAMPTCNPPPPQAYKCPDNIKIDVSITIVASGGMCVVEHEPVHCPPHAMCNPPPPQKVPCP